MWNCHLYLLNAGKLPTAQGVTYKNSIPRLFSYAFHLFKVKTSAIITLKNKDNHSKHVCYHLFDFFDMLLCTLSYLFYCLVRPRYNSNTIISSQHLPNACTWQQNQCLNQRPQVSRGICSLGRAWVPILSGRGWWEAAPKALFLWGTSQALTLANK